MTAAQIIANRFSIPDLQKNLLGRGGMGAVYQGLDLLTGEVVAIKALNPELVTLNPETITRFHREAEALRKLNHPNVVRMIAAIEEEGRHYLIVEFIDGGSLRQFLDRERRLPVRQVLRIALELADALSRTHHLRIIHRDIKPANVLLTAEGVPKLSDFGVASMADTGYLTQTGMWVGTPQYLSPEACNGEKLDERADIWAFGILLYEMLAGRPPFVGETLMATLTAIFRQPLPDLTLLRNDVPEALSNLIQHMLLKERERRISSMRLVAAELEAILQGKPSPGQLSAVQWREPTNLAELPPLEFESLVGEALKQYRDGDWLALADSPLAHGNLITPYFLPGEPVTRDSRAQALRVMLHWGIEKLNPGGAQDWLASAWRHYNILYYFYVAGLRVADLVELMGIAEQTFYGSWRPQAVAALARILQDEVTQMREEEDRQRFALLTRYQRRTAGEQKLLRLLTIFAAEEYVPLEWVYALVTDVDVAASLHELSEAYLVQRDELITAVRLNRVVYPHLSGLLTLEERVQWHAAVARLHLAAQTYLEAARHFRQAGDYEQAALVLIQHRAAIFDKLQLEGLRSLLAQFRPHELHDRPNVWAQLKIVAGRVAEYLKDVETAVAEYGEALSASDIQVKAEAYYRRAKVLERIDLDECLAHYAYVVDLLERSLLTTRSDLDLSLMTLLTRIYVDRAWIYIQERPDWDKAAVDLHRTEEIMHVVSPEDRAAWAELYTAWAGLYAKKGEAEQSLHYRLQAWVAANETQNVELVLKTAYNLGRAYVWNKQYQSGMKYLELARKSAEKSANLQMQGVCYKGIGNAYFFQGEYAQAIEQYEHAYRIWTETKNRNWQAHICYDLAEAHVHLGQWLPAREFYREGVTIAEEVGQQGLLAQFANLVAAYPVLMETSSVRENLVLAYLQERQQLAIGEYMDLTRLSRSQAHRDLQALVRKGVLQREGQGRGARYVLRQHS